MSHSAAVSFEFSTAGRIVFGAGALTQAPGLVAGLGTRPLVVTGSTTERARPLLALLAARDLEVGVFAVPGEPDVDRVREGTLTARQIGCDCVVGFGGGAALDAAKAIAVLATNPGDVLDYLEIIGRGMKPTTDPLPCIAIPTTAGTGSEVTRNSVIASRQHRVKVSLRSQSMLPRVALVDPELTYVLPPPLTATTGLDALTQLIEPFVCTRANPFTDGLCEGGMIRVASALRLAFSGGAFPGPPSTVPPDVAAARENMAVASLFGGLGLANAGLGAVHGIAGPLGGMIDAPHGALCASLLPTVVEANLRALRERVPQSPALPRYRRVARLLTGDPDAIADDAVAWLRRLVTDLGIPGLSAHGVGAELVPDLVVNAARASSMKANPVKLTREELTAIVEAAL